MPWVALGIRELWCHEVSWQWWRKLAPSKFRLTRTRSTSPASRASTYKLTPTELGTTDWPLSTLLKWVTKKGHPSGKWRKKSHRKATKLLVYRGSLGD